jgi:hypothetical protein
MHLRLGVESRYDTAKPFASFTMKQALFAFPQTSRVVESGGPLSRFARPPQRGEQHCQNAWRDQEQIPTQEWREVGHD